MRLETSKILSNYINKQISSKEFQEWVYNDQNLESELGEKIYLELLSLDLRNEDSYKNVEQLLDNCIDYAQLHKNEIVKLINQICEKQKSFNDSISELYQWMNKGYLFLSKIDTIGNFNEQGKSIIHSIEDYMNDEEKWNILGIREPGFFNDLIQIKTQILNNQILITGKYEIIQFYGKQFEYIEKSI
ncbi:hypothetical protein [Aquimarina rubra]|uniref:Uncharacterized protein n=1 Tax=Aquimarina rubra TaxID=1920033 RepID=A0ABW5LK17_9FLAO